MHRTLAYGYLVFGFVIGVGYSVGMEGSAAVTEERFMYFLVALILMSLWQWFESISHWRHITRWGKLSAKGRRRFIVMRYVVGRGLVFLAGTVAVVVSLKPLSGGAFIALATGFGALVCLLAWLGNLEWNACVDDAAQNAFRKSLSYSHDPPSPFSSPSSH